MMDKRGFNPIAKMMDLAEQMEQIDDSEGEVGRHFDKRLKLYVTLAKFYAPQPKSLDINVKQDSTLTIQAVDYSSLLAERQAFIPVPMNRKVALLGVEETLEAELDG
ncbi:MAG TPA: hypothetical protein VN081_03970 [Dongiaceae bacterium]|nr:hypothetical protein [Dongiaceae bacterium]